MTEHKHAEVLRAIADGKEVQFFSDLEGDWVDCLNVIELNPITRSYYEWRVKPERKHDYVRHIGFDYDGPTSNQLDGASTFLTKQGWEYAINITFDGETNEPKSAELAK